MAVSATPALSTAALASGGGTGEEDNIPIAENTTDDSSVFEFSFSIKRVVADVVDNDNAAIAIASCNRCQTVAIAVQVVLIFSDPSVVTTDNLAFAVNIEVQSLRDAGVRLPVRAHHWWPRPLHQRGEQSDP